MSGVRTNFMPAWSRPSAASLIWLAALLGPTHAQGQPFAADPAPADYIRRSGDAALIPNGHLALDGHAEVCGQSVTVLDPRLNDYAAAFPRFIVLNPSLFAKVATPVKLWIYGHECGHVSGLRDEAQADCFGVVRGLREGWLTPQGLDQICAFIGIAQPDAAHFAGPERCALMRACYAKNAKR